MDEHICASSTPTSVLPAEPPKRPNIIIKLLAIPRYLLGKKFTPTANTIFELEQQLRNTTKLNTVQMKSVKMLIATHANADTIDQTPAKKSHILSMELNSKSKENMLKMSKISTHRK